jgi:hypothetical protein
MARKNWWTVGKFALLCAIAGPILGVAVFWWAPLALSSLISGAFADIGLVTLWAITNVLLLFPGSAPLAAALGGLGTYVLLRALEQGREQRGVRLIGVVYGAVAGIGMSVFAVVQGQPYGAFGGGLTLLLGAVQVDPTEPAIQLVGGMAAGGGTGMLLGYFVAARVGRGLEFDQTPRSTPGGA